MSFKPLTQDKESLQALAFAMRQDKGSDITQDELKEAMMDLSAVSPRVRSCCDIDYTKLTARFSNWYEIGTEKDIEEWTNSSVWTANSLIPTRFLRGGDYVFSNEIGDPTFRGAFRELAKDISKNAKDSVVRTVYTSLAKGTGDKWNPADVLAIKKSKMGSIVGQMESFKKGKVETDQNDHLVAVRKVFDNYNLISALHSYKAEENSFYNNIIPPLQLLSDEDKIKLFEKDMNLNPESIDTVNIEVFSENDSAGIKLEIAETTEDSGVFEGIITITKDDQSSGNRLYALPDSEIIAKYTDRTLPKPYNTNDDLDILAKEIIISNTPISERLSMNELEILSQNGELIERFEIGPVSYTHLTLPTKRIV